MSSRSKIRALLALALFASVIAAAPWIAGIFAVILSLRWRAWEVVAAGLLMDFLWLPASVSFTSIGTIPLATPIAIIVVFGLEPLRRQLLLGPLIE